MMPAGLAIAARMQSQVDGLEQAVRNANDGIAMLQVAEGAVVEISNMLSRMRELAIQAASGTYSATDRAALNLELQQLFLEIQRIAVNTEWNGISILNGEKQRSKQHCYKDKRCVCRLVQVQVRVWLST